MIAGLALVSVLASSPFAADATGPSLLWVPAAEPDVAGLEQLLAKRPELRLAVAVAPEELQASSAAVLARLWQEGRIEPVLRLPGDPILPLSAPAKRELKPRLAALRQTFQRAFGRPAEGFSPGGGALDDASLRTLAALDLKWAIGASPSTAAYRDTHGLLVIPGLAPAAGAAPDAEACLVFDEGSGLLPPGSALAAIEALAESAAPRAWILPSARPAVEAAGSPEGRSWAGDLGPWNGRPAQVAAMARLAEAAAALERYQNSGTAGLETLDEAGAVLRRLDSGRRLAKAEELEAETASLLAKVYALLGQRPPEELVAALSSTAGLILFEAAPGRLAFRNPELSSGACVIESLEVALVGKEVAFVITLASGGPSATEAPSVDLYIDVNHRQGVGSAQLLPGRPGFVRAADAWEYALALSRGQAQFYRFVTPRPTASGALQAQWEPRSRALRSTLPAGRIKGDPASWGYLAVCVKPGDTDGEVLGVLASSSEQRQLDHPKTRGRARFSAQRLPPKEQQRVRQQP